MGIIDREMARLPTLPEVEFFRPLSDDNQRLVNQGGLFTRSPSSTDLQTWLFENNNTDNEALALVKILIPNSEREVALRALNRMNINHLSLFPDLDGASKYCNLFSQVENY